MRALIVSSTQPRWPVGTLPWVRATIAAVDELSRETSGLITSFGTAAWDLVLCRAAEASVAVHVIAPVASAANSALDHVMTEYALRPELVSWEPLRSARSAGRLKDVWARRDQAAFSAADRIFPVCVRPGGRIDGLLQAHREKVDDRFRVAWQKARAVPRGWCAGLQWRPPERWPARALLHLTRSSDGPWPGETMHSYWADVASSEHRYPRDAFSTLCRILREGRIRASRFRIRGGASTVSLTAIDPSKASGLLRWRARYARYSFEPYAVAIARDAVERLGGRPVRYDDGAHDAEADPFRQGRGAQAHWEAEQEWRVQGDLKLSRIDPSELAAIVASDQEAVALDAAFPGLNVGVFEGPGPTGCG